MATNENVNKVIYGNQTVMDITDTTAEESDVANGEVFYKADGSRSVGTLNADSAVWGNITGTLSDQTDLQTELNRAYTKTASETSSIDDLDLIPVQKISASSDGRRNIKFSNLKSVLKTYFDNIYSTFSGSFNDLTDKPTVDQTYSATSDNAQSGTAVAEVVEQIYADNGVLGAKNLLPNNAKTQTINGVTFTVNEDGSVTANGTATANAQFTLFDGYIANDNKDVILSGSPANGSQSAHKLSTWNYDKSQAFNDYGKGVFISGSSHFQVSITIYSGYTADNLVFYPMFRLASDPDDTYVPYAKTNREITEELTAINSGLDDWTATAQVQSDNTVTFTGLDDNYGYDLYCQDKLIGCSAMSKTGSGTSVQIVYTVTGAASGDVCKLRILK